MVKLVYFLALIATQSLTAYAAQQCNAGTRKINGRTCQITCNVDRSGGDYARSRTGSFEACVQACAADSKCATAQYHEDNYYCYFKNKKNSLSSARGVDTVDCEAPKVITTTTTKTTTTTTKTTTTTTTTTPPPQRTSCSTAEASACGPVCACGIDVGTSQPVCYYGADCGKSDAARQCETDADCTNSQGDTKCIYDDAVVCARVTFCVSPGTCPNPNPVKRQLEKVFERAEGRGRWDRRANIAEVV